MAEFACVHSVVIFFISDYSMFYRVQSSLSALSPERRCQDDSLPASSAYLADVFLVKGILSSLPGIAVETQVARSDFRGVTRNLFSKCMK